MGWTLFALVNGFALEGDNASIAVRTHDLLSGNPPFLGMPSTSANDAPGVIAFHPGPVQFMMMAPFYALSQWHTFGIMLGALVVNLGLVAIALRTAWRIGSPYVVRAVFTGLVLTMHLYQQVLFRPWNTYPVSIGAVPLVVLAWGIAVGKRGLWPWFVLVASIVAQGHLFGLALLGFAILGLVVAATRTRGVAKPSLRELLVTLLIFVFSWALPLMDLVGHWPGNLGEIWAYVTADRIADGVRHDLTNWLIWLVALSAAGIMAAFRGHKAFKRRTNLSENEFIYSAGYLILASMVIGLVVFSVVGGVGRQYYLSMAEGVGFLAIVSLWVRKDYWWTRWTKPAIVVVAIFIVTAALQAPSVKDRLQTEAQATQVVEAARVLLDNESSLPIVLTENGERSWISLTQAVRLALILDGENLYFDHPGRPDEYDAQRRIKNIEGAHLILRIEDQEQDGTWPVLDIEQVIGQEIVEFDGDEAPIRLTLFHGD